MCVVGRFDRPTSRRGNQQEVGLGGGVLVEGILEDSRPGGDPSPESVLVSDAVVQHQSCDTAIFIAVS